MLDGKFYDAGAYKADPVPMALQRDTVYEGLKTGVSQGLFTVSGALHTQGGWVAAGKWLSHEQIESEKTKQEAERRGRAARGAEPEAGPPRLSRSREQAVSPPPPQSKPSGKAESESEKTARMSPTVEAPDRPILRRQPKSESAPQEKSQAETETLQGPLQWIAAISDADGPEPRPYTFVLKPEEEQGFRKKMLALVAGDVRDRADQLSSGTRTSGARSRQEPEFTDVQLRAFDVSTTNEAVLVLTAKAKLAASARDLEYMTVLVARQDIYGELHKVFSQTTDNQHLDVIPRYELIDAVDADGDGRAELLFRENWDSGQAFVVYRVTGDRLWPLFEGKPGA